MVRSSSRSKGNAEIIRSQPVYAVFDESGAGRALAPKGYKMKEISESEIDEHRDFLMTLGIGRREIDAVIGVLHANQRGDEVAMPYYTIALLPAHMALNFIEGDRRQYEVRPHLWGADDRAWFEERAVFYELAAIIMDMRSRRGDEEAAAVADAVRSHVGFLRAFQGTRTAQA